MRSTTTRASWGPVLVVCGLAVTCGPPLPQQHATPPRAAASAAAVVPATAAPPAPSAAPTSSDAPGEPAPPERPARVSVGTTTPGKVQCDTTVCDLATEVCCFAPQSGVGRCVPKPPLGYQGMSPCCPTGASIFCGNPEHTIERLCDEMTDCQLGERCCAGYAGEGDLAREECATSCGEERCLPGSTCRNGNTCPASEHELGSRCPLRVEEPRCGTSECAAGEVCCWHRDEESGRCAAQCDTELERTFECTRPTQCDGYPCNDRGTGSYRCGGDGFEFGVLCDKLADCPKHLSSLGPYAKAVRCEHAAGLPTGVKQCVYE
jgi:hypothetical protein